MEEIIPIEPQKYEDVMQMPTREVFLRCKELNSMPVVRKVILKDGRDWEIMKLPEDFVPKYPTIRDAWLSQRSQELQRTSSGVLLTDELVERTVFTIQKNLNTGSYTAIITLDGRQSTPNKVATAESVLTSMPTPNNTKPQFEVVLRIPTKDVFLRGKELKSMPAIEEIKLNDGTDAVILWLPEGFEPRYPTVRFAWLSQNSEKLQRTPTGVLPDDEFVNRTALYIQKNLSTGTYGATINVERQRSDRAVAADIFAW